MEVKSSINMTLSSNDTLSSKVSKVLDNSMCKSLDCIHICPKCGVREESIFSSEAEGHVSATGW